jgi:hypothetical protein
MPVDVDGTKPVTTVRVPSIPFKKPEASDPIRG